MNKYLQVPDSIIDLHGYTTAEARDILDDVLGGDDKHIRIITGKGKHSENGPVLRDFVKNYLDSRRVRFNQSKIQDGGEGSLEVFLN
ncbi:MAG: Smr/MutS family protein [Minisyncoccia bacterium]